MLIEFSAALAAAIICINVFQTFVAYPQLPDRVPLQFEWSGEIRTYGPRIVIWFVVVLQIALAVGMVFTGYALVNHAPGVHGTPQGFAIFAVLFNVMLWRVQSLLISAAKSPQKRVSMSGFALFFGICVALILIDAFVIG